MSDLLVPLQLTDLIERSEHVASLAQLVSACEGILADNKLEFFPAYTDHGLAHVNGVLADAVRLVPPETWNSGVLTPDDAVVLVAGILLHDIALHLTPSTFVAAITDSASRPPTQWFGVANDSRGPDADWSVLWREFRKEVRHMATSQLTLIIGPDGEPPACCYSNELTPEAWTLSDRQVIGEFIRRNHCRIAHEVAIYGFPGLKADDFPVLATSMSDLADAIGVLARSHGESLNVMRDYLQYVDPGNKRPYGVVLPYLMALLRVSDFAQIHAARAPRLLLKLRDPQSPLTFAEWAKHAAVPRVSWDHQDPRAIHVVVSQSHGYRTHLALQELLAQFEDEIDRSISLLDYEYGQTDLSMLQLRKQRLTSNLSSAALEQALPFVPERVSLRSDRDLFRLVVRDLYGDEPEVAGRELLQNAIDAVRALGVVGSLDEPAVTVTVRENADGSGVLAVVDRGIGMTPRILADYFLTAGASFTARGRGVDVVPVKAGRFGVGAFAAFLLGDRIQISTRHVEERKGIQCEATLGGDLVELQWTTVEAHGTTVEVPFRTADLQSGAFELIHSIAKYHVLPEPLVEFRFVAADGSVTPVIPSQQARLDSPGWLACETSVVPRLQLRRPKVDAADDFSDFGHSADASVVHNGVLVDDPQFYRDARSVNRSNYEWSREDAHLLVGRPCLVADDPAHVTPLALSRYGFSSRTLPFEPDLVRTIGRDVASCAAVTGRFHPLLDRGPWWEPFSAISVSGEVFPPFAALVQRYLSCRLVVWWNFAGSHPWAGRPSNIEAPVSLARGLGIGASVTLSPSELQMDEVDPITLQREGYPLWSFEHAVLDWAALLGCQHIATVVCRRRSEAPQPPPGDGDSSSSDALRAWRSVGRCTVAEGPGVFFLGAAPQDVEVEAALAAALATRPGSKRLLTAASVFEPGGTLTEFDHHLSAGWNELIGGPLDLANRPALSDQLLADDWRSISAAGLFPPTRMLG
jgi:Histidine kinase-, DNA gyrase B-, and HSP90-like ATPase